MASQVPGLHPLCGMFLCRTSAADADPGWPSNIFITFQFYRFPPVASQRLRLLSSDGAEGLPCILATVGKDGTVNSGKSDQRKHKVGQAFVLAVLTGGNGLSAGEKRCNVNSGGPHEISRR